MDIAALPEFSTLTVAMSSEPDVLVVTLDRPDRLNAINADMMTELTQMIDAVDLSPTLRSVILTGAGAGFCAGADLQGSSAVPPGAEGVTPTVRTFMTQDQIATVNERIHRSRKPWIAAVNGAAVGGGLAMALACDIRFASPAAKFGAVFIKVGVSNCDMGTSYFLPRLIGASKSAELMLTGRIIDAAEAESNGLVTAVVEADQLMERALETARLIGENPPFGTWMTKETMWQTIDSPSLRHALDIENRTQIMCTGTGELKEAMSAFQEKRPPNWSGL